MEKYGPLNKSNSKSLEILNSEEERKITLEMRKNLKEQIKSLIAKINERASQQVQSWSELGYNPERLQELTDELTFKIELFENQIAESKNMTIKYQNTLSTTLQDSITIKNLINQEYHRQNLLELAKQELELELENLPNELIKCFNIEQSRAKLIEKMIQELDSNLGDYILNKNINFLNQFSAKRIVILDLNLNQNFNFKNPEFGGSARLDQNTNSLILEFPANSSQIFTNINLVSGNKNDVTLEITEKKVDLTAQTWTLSYTTVDRNSIND